MSAEPVGTGGLVDKPDREPAEDRAPVLMLGLYLLLLAFFILLNGISTVEKDRVGAVVGSLTSTFRTQIGSGTGLDLENVAPVLSDFLLAQAFQEDVSELFRTVVPLSEVEISRPGELMSVAVPASSLFEEGSARLKGARRGLVAAIAEALRNAPDGIRYDVECVAGTYAQTDKDQRPPELEIERAAALAQALEEAGAPAGSLGVGLRPGAPGRVFIGFFTLDLKAGKPDRAVPGRRP